MTRNVDTTKISGGADYAKVADRLKKFREDWPNSKTETDYITLEDGSIEFKAWIWKDKTEYLEVLKTIGNKLEARGSADADGDARGQIDPNKVKDFEKLQSVAIGRALAMLGYMASGEVASFEEMELYYKDKADKQRQYVEDVTIELENAKTLAELKDTWMAVTNKALPEIIAAKDKRKAQLEAKAPKPKKEKPDAKA